MLVVLVSPRSISSCVMLFDCMPELEYSPLVLPEKMLPPSLGTRLICTPSALVSAVMPLVESTVSWMVSWFWL